MIDFLKRWGMFISERFDPLSHAQMILTFVGANAYFTHAISGTSFTITNLVLSLVVCTLIFFHLRLFDEWKDYDVDCEVNPDRPLPRGLIELREYKFVMAAVIVLEITAAALIGPHAVIAVLVPIGYSLLMFVEFFVGDWLRPKLELYAVTHTLISAWITVFIYAALTDTALHEIPAELTVVMVLAWMLFNIFEFARKTYARDEERPDVESYSKRLTPLGASALVWVPIAAALVSLYVLVEWGYLAFEPFAVAAGLSLVAWLTSVVYLIRNTPRFGQLYRGVHSLYLVAFNAVFAVYGMMTFAGV